LVPSASFPLSAKKDGAKGRTAGPDGPARRPGRPRHALTEPRLERFIGVIYRPDTERWSRYGEAILPRLFDGWRLVR
jgi:erythromycin esterase-like protein